MFYNTIINNTKIKTAQSVEKGRILNWIVVTNNSFWEEVKLNNNVNVAADELYLCLFLKHDFC